MMMTMMTMMMLMIRRIPEPLLSNINKKATCSHKNGAAENP